MLERNIGFSFPYKAQTNVRGFTLRQKKYFSLSGRRKQKHNETTPLRHVPRHHLHYASNNHAPP